MGPFRGWMVLGVVLSAAATCTSVGLMAMSAYLISKSALVTMVADVAVIVTAVRCFALTRAGLRYAERYVTHKASFRILTGLRVWCYRAVEPLAPARLQPDRGGDLLARLVGDIETLEGFYLRVVVPPLAAVLVAALACFILGQLDARLGVALAVLLALAGVGLPLASRRLSRRAAAELIGQRAELNAALVDEIQGLADLLACGQEGAHDVIQGLPDGYDTLIGENGLLLAGGERQRLAIARAILKDAPILVLDEPTAHLDALTEQRVWQALEEFMAGRTTLLITHHRAGLALMDQVIGLENGRIVRTPARA
jgi:ABC-type transport system involved in cytochrome bd biosynthesis fused ATPase/permease subunit